MSRLTMDKIEAIVKIESDKAFNDKINKARTHLEETATKVFKTEDKSPKFDDYLYDEQWIRKNTSVTLHFPSETSTRKDYETISLIGYHFPTACYTSGASLKDEKGLTLKALKEWKKVKEDKKKFSSKLNSTLRTFTTEKKMAESFPELAQYCEEKSKALSIIPTEQINDLRKTLKGNK